MAHKNGHCDCGKLALAVAITSSIFYSICAVVVALMPQFMVKLVSAVHHIDISELATPVTIPGFVTGLVASFVFAYLFVIVAGFIYHALHGSDMKR